MALPELTTRRLRLRDWREEDRAPFAALNGDLEVTRYLTGPLVRGESDHLFDRIVAHIQEHGFGLWALEVVEDGRFVGFTGLMVPSFEAHFTPAVEIGWRLARAAWGHGFASEAAAESLRFGFEQLQLAEIVSFTVPQNVRSRAVMERIGMQRDAGGDFEHPRIAEGHPLRSHVLYRLSRERWARGNTRADGGSDGGGNRP